MVWGSDSCMPYVKGSCGQGAMGHRRPSFRTRGFLAPLNALLEGIGTTGNHSDEKPYKLDVEAIRPCSWGIWDRMLGNLPGYSAGFRDEQQATRLLILRLPGPRPLPGNRPSSSFFSLNVRLARLRRPSVAAGTGNRVPPRPIRKRQECALSAAKLPRDGKEEAGKGALRHVGPT
jgi:hypothetical protein